MYRTRIINLIEQLDWKRTILLDLDKQISAGIGDDDLEAEILESEEIQSDISSTTARVKQLMEKLQAPPHPLVHHHPHKCHKLLQTGHPAAVNSN